MADVQKKMPKSLYYLSVACVGSNLHKRASDRNILRTLPENVLIDIYYKMLKDKRVCNLGNELGELDVFARLLRELSARIRLLRCFQAVMDHSSSLAEELSTKFTKRCSASYESDLKTKDAVIDLGIRLGGFLADAGWFTDSEKVLLAVQNLCQASEQSEHILCLTLQCCYRLLHTQTSFCCFEGASKTAQLSLEIIEELQKKYKQYVPNLAALYTELSRLHFNRSEYDESYQCSVNALKHLRTNIPAKVKVDVLRQAAKSCVVKRDFQKAGLLIKQAVYLAKEIFGPEHPKYSDALLDYGFFLLNVDSIAHSVKIHKDALDIKCAIFGKFNIHVAIAHEDLAYALYVHEYSSGRFYKARENAEKAIEIMQDLVPNDHLMLASAKRVKALILEEIALDNPEEEIELLKESESLHLVALNLSLKAFGEKNVQTAKHYGNLGRLYQSMRKFTDAEVMHLKAIAIKEELLGKEDYEVGLSIGHLASLYNYHMYYFKEAETLYHRSIAISLKLFGQTYSGLEYDYRGLVHVYHELQDDEHMLGFEDTLARWRLLRTEQLDFRPLEPQPEPVTIEEVTNKFFAMCSSDC